MLIFAVVLSFAGALTSATNPQNISKTEYLKTGGIKVTLDLEGGFESVLFKGYVDKQLVEVGETVTGEFKYDDVAHQWTFATDQLNLQEGDALKFMILATKGKKVFGWKHRHVSGTTIIAQARRKRHTSKMPPPHVKGMYTGFHHYRHFIRSPALSPVVPIHRHPPIALKKPPPIHHKHHFYRRNDLKKQTSSSSSTISSEMTTTTSAYVSTTTSTATPLTVTTPYITSTSATPKTTPDWFKSIDVRFSNDIVLDIEVPLENSKQ